MAVLFFVVEKWDVRVARRRVALLMLVPAVVALIAALLIFEALQPGFWF
jgi:capsular polysaccharide biosynthesis protein